jgi:hypothetical protein
VSEWLISLDMNGCSICVMVLRLWCLRCGDLNNNVICLYFLIILCVLTKQIENQDYVKHRLFGLVVRVPGYRTKMFCVTCEV